MMILFSVLLISFAFTFLTTGWLIKKLEVAGITGRDMCKHGHPDVPEMGGLAILGGFIVGVLLAIGLFTFNLLKDPVNLTNLLAGLSTILIMALIGIIDDLFIMRQRVKALLPVFAALPLIAVKAGVTTMTLPFIGPVNFGIFYVLVFIPIAITGAANATNMLAGFNGLEAGIGIVITGTCGLIAFITGRIDATIIAFAMFGSLLAFLRYNWFPARILVGDIGTLTIGASFATIVILGNIEQVGAILILPFFLELYLKAKSKFQAESWCNIRNNLLICENKKDIFGIGRLIMYVTSGIPEKDLVLSIISIELIFALLAVLSIVGVN